MRHRETKIKLSTKVEKNKLHQAYTDQKKTVRQNRHKVKKSVCEDKGHPKL